MSRFKRPSRCALHVLCDLCMLCNCFWCLPEAGARLWGCSLRLPATFDYPALVAKLQRHLLSFALPAILRILQFQPCCCRRAAPRCPSNPLERRLVCWWQRGPSRRRLASRRISPSATAAQAAPSAPPKTRPAAPAAATRSPSSSAALPAASWAIAPGSAKVSMH